MEILNYILAGFTVVSIIGTLAASFYGVSQKATIEILEKSNAAFKVRNDQLEEQLKDLTADYSKQISELTGRVGTLEKIKTPPYEPMIKLIENGHQQILAAIKESK